MGKIQNAVGIMFATLFCIVICYGIWGEVFLQDERLSDEGFCNTYTEGWSQLLPDGGMIDIVVPSNLDDYGQGSVTICNKIPNNIGEDEYIVFLGSKQDIDVYIDGQLREAFSTKATRVFGKNSPTYYLTVRLKGDDAGKSISITCYSKSKYVGAVSEILYANYRGFSNYIMDSQAPGFAVAIVMAIISIISLAISLGLAVIYKKKQILTSISIGVLIVALWMIFDSMFRQYMFPNVSVISDVTFMMVALLPFPFAAFADQIQGKRYEKIYLAIKILNIAEIIIAMLLYCFGICELFESFIVMAGILGILLFTIVVTVIRDVITHHIKEYLLLAIALFLAGFVMLVLIIIYLQSDETFNITLATIGLFVLLAVTMVNTIRDIYTLSREKQEALKKSYAKSQFLANMSHEIRTPINTILGMNSMILRKNGDKEIAGYSQDIQSACKILLSLINDILDFSKIESGKMELLDNDYDIVTILGDISATIKNLATDKGLEFNLVVDERLPRYMFGDDRRIRQILINLLSNAVKYTQEGNVTFSIQLEALEDGYADLHFWVKDTGIGVKSEDILKLSKEYVRVDEMENKNIEGTGLGISIVVNLLKMMNSELLIESTYNEGSTFHFILKQKVISNEVVGNIQDKIDRLYIENDEAESFTISGARLLVVDDNMINRKVFVHLLSDMQCTIDEADSGKACLELVQSNKYDIIFMDYMMPEMDGVQTLHCMKDLGDYVNAATPVVIVTANAISGAREAYLAEGFDQYLSKPIDIKKLRKIISSYIEPEKKKVCDGNDEKDIDKAGEVNDENEITDVRDELPDIDGVNWDIALFNMEKTEVLKGAISDFLVMANMEMITLEEVYGKIEESYAEFRIQAHSMKTHAATIGAVHVAGLAKYLEYAARDEELDTIERLMPLFSVQWRQLVSQLDSAFGKKKYTDIKKQPIAAEELKDKLDALSAAVDDVDIDEADRIIEELDAYSFEADAVEVFERLKAYVLDMDSDNTVMIIDKWKKLIK